MNSTFFKNKKAADMWFILVMGLVALAVGVLLLFINSKGIGAADKNLASLSGCKQQKGICEETCGAGKAAFYKYGGCPDNPQEPKKEYCCIPNSPA